MPFYEGSWLCFSGRILLQANLLPRLEIWQLSWQKMQLRGMFALTVGRGEAMGAESWRRQARKA